MPEKKYSLGQYLKDIMDSRGWNPARLAKETKISRSYLIQIMEESNPSSGGKAPNITIEKLIQLNEGLKIPITNFVTAYRGYKPEEEPSPQDDAYLRLVINLIEKDKMLFKKALAQVFREDL